MKATLYWKNKPEECVKCMNGENGFPVCVETGEDFCITMTEVNIPSIEEPVHDILGDTDGDIPEVATHWEKYNDSKWWDKNRFYQGKYQIVACTGSPWDYTYETVDATNRWKEARRLEGEGADVYVEGKRVHFVVHEAVNNAFKTLKGLFLTRQCFLWDDDYMDPEDVIDIEEAWNALKQNGFKINEEWQRKVWEREENKCHVDPLTVPLMERPRFLFRAVDTDELPF